jgi:hypothetical protein
MHRPAFALQAATGLAITSLLAAPLAGCSGTSSALPATPLSAPSARTSEPAPAQGMGSQAQLSAQIETDAHHKKKVKLLFVSDNENNRVLVFNAATKTQNPPPLRTQKRRTGRICPCIARLRAGRSKVCAVRTPTSTWDCG